MKIQINYIFKRQALSTTVLALTLAMTSGITQAESSVTVVADGLNNPRGLDFAPNGALYVAEAGIGAGDGDAGSALGIGFSGSITEISGVNSPEPVWHRIVTGLLTTLTY